MVNDLIKKIGAAQGNMSVCRNVSESRCLDSRSPSESEAQNLLSSLVLCSCGPTLTLEKVGMGRVHFKSAWGQVRT